MLKSLLIFSLGLTFCYVAKAQQNNVSQKDTLVYYMKFPDHVAATKQEALFILMIMPYDTISKLYPVNEFYLDGTKRAMSTASNNDCTSLKLEGAKIEFFQNGRRKRISNYHNGKLLGDDMEYYPNGKMYAVSKFEADDKRKLIECSDSTGNKITENGNGKWMEWDDEFKNIVVRGAVKDSLKEGEWQGMDGTKIICVTLYKKGNFISGIRYDRSGKPHTYTKFDVEPTYKNSPADFSAYLASTIKYPDSDRANGTQGKVIVTFVVERDGSLSNVKALQGPSQSTMDEVVHVIQQAPAWLPGVQNGRPVRVQYTISFAFSLGTSNY